MLSMPLLLVSAQIAANPLPRCSVTKQPVAMRIEDLPPAVLKALPYKIANPDEPFNKTDAISKGQEAWPFARLICGYPTSDGYSIEREQGGRGYNVGTLKLRKTAAGYELE